MPNCVDEDDDGDGDPDLSDCSSLDATIYTGAPESCDAIDSDCDGDLVDEFIDTDADTEPDCIDDDDDGDGDPDATDCDDADATIYTGAPESCDAVDSDCDGDLVENYYDTDGDGVPNCVDEDDDDDGDPDATDCDDIEPTTYTGAPELCNAVDDDCDGAVPPDELDDDGDGQAECEGDCDDLDATNFEGNLEVCDGGDNDCDLIVPVTELDDDGDGQAECEGDCDDADPANFDGNPEVCDAADNDCDGLLSADELDGDGDGLTACAGDCDNADPTAYPGAPELCDGADNDCDGTVDEGVELTIVGGGAGARIPPTSTIGTTIVTALGLSDATIVDLEVEIDLTHTYMEDLEITLTSPEGTSVLLFDRRGGNANDLIDTVFDDDASVDIEDGSAPFTGSFVPEEPLSDFDGEGAGGLWTLTIADLATVDHGNLGGWELRFVLDGGPDTDGDGFGLCADCDDDSGDAWPGAPAACDGLDNDCDGTLSDDEAVVGGSPSCAADDCQDVLAADPNAVSGPYVLFVPALGGTLEVSCDMDTQGGGWIELSLEDSENVLIAGHSYGNPWHKCADNAAQFFDSIFWDWAADEDYLSTTGLPVPVTLEYNNPGTGAVYSAAEVSAIRTLITELAESTRMVVTTADDDSGSYQDGDGYGHEVYAYDEAATSFLLSPGTNGNCGGPTNWPVNNSQSAFYLWSTSAAQSEESGTTGISDADLGALPATHLLPVSVDLVVATGGGVSFGWEEAELLVR